jgi:DNA-binding transcriptional MerR regulator
LFREKDVTKVKLIKHFAEREFALKEIKQVLEKIPLETLKEKAPGPSKDFLSFLNKNKVNLRREMVEL